MQKDPKSRNPGRVTWQPTSARNPQGFVFFEFSFWDLGFV